MSKHSSTIEQYNRHVAGKQAKCSGDNFEAQLDAYHALLIETDQAVYIRRQMPPMRSVYRGGQTVFVPTGPGPCDYIFVLPYGQVGIFDAKSTGNKNQFSWPSAQHHQLDEMRTFTVGPAFALVEWRSAGEVRAHQYHSIADGIVRREEGVLVDGIEWLGIVR